MMLDAGGPLVHANALLPDVARAAGARNAGPVAAARAASAVHAVCLAERIAAKCSIEGVTNGSAANPF